MSSISITTLFKQKAKALGFDGIAIAKAEYMDEEAKRLETWLENGHHGSMNYLADHFDKRIDPTKLVHGAKSVVSLMFNYYTEDKQSDPDAPKISMYAYGRDYHKVVKKRLVKLFKWFQEEVGDVGGRCFVDSAPILERDWAKRSGLGWVGKNAMIISPQKGSYFFLAEIICDYEFEYDLPLQDHCGSCTRCIDACPTEAIAPDGYIVDGSKCISYLTIELKDSIPPEYQDKMEGWMYGCDICQQVCPWNRFSKQHNEPDFNSKTNLLDITKDEWIDLDEITFDYLFFGSPVKRTQYKGLKRNIKYLFPNSD